MIWRSPCGLARWTVGILRPVVLLWAGTTGRPTARSTSLLRSRVLTQCDEKFVKLIERLDHCLG